MPPIPAVEGSEGWAAEVWRRGGVYLCGWAPGMKAYRTEGAEGARCPPAWPPLQGSCPVGETRRETEVRPESKHLMKSINKVFTGGCHRCVCVFHLLLLGRRVCWRGLGGRGAHGDLWPRL